MIKKTAALLSAFAMLVSLSALAVADELDRSEGKVPSGLIVRKNTETNSVEIYKADGLAKITSTKEGLKANSKFISEENEVTSVSEKSELDRGSSVDSWYYYPCTGYSPYYPYYGYGGYPSYNYGYYSYGSYYNYYPYYGYNYGSYSYYYYYGYNSWWY